MIILERRIPGVAAQLHCDGHLLAGDLTCQKLSNKAVAKKECALPEATAIDKAGCAISALERVKHLNTTCPNIVALVSVNSCQQSPFPLRI